MSRNNIKTIIGENYRLDLTVSTDYEKETIRYDVGFVDFPSYRYGTTSFADFGQACRFFKAVQKLNALSENDLFYFKTDNNDDWEPLHHEKVLSVMVESHSSHVDDIFCDYFEISEDTRTYSDDYMDVYAIIDPQKRSVVELFVKYSADDRFEASFPIAKVMGEQIYGRLQDSADEDFAEYANEACG